MFPIDGEFEMVYFLYFLLFAYVFYQIGKSNKSNKIRLIIIITICLVLNTFLFYDSTNFEGGGSLVVLFYSGIIFILTIISLLTNQIYYSIQKKKFNKQ